MFVFADKPNKWNSVNSKVRALISTNLLDIFDLQQLDEWECEYLIDKMLDLEHQNKLSVRHLNLSKEERLTLCKKTSERHFVVAMHQLRYGQRFSDIIINEYENIPSDLGKELYIFTCLCDYIGINLPYSLAINILNLTNAIEINDVLSSTDGVLRIENQKVYPRHSRIAKEIFRFFFQSKEQVHIFLIKLFSIMPDYKNVKVFSALYLNLFSSDTAYKQIIKALAKDCEMLDEILDIILNSMHLFNNDLYLKYLIFNANIQKNLNNNERALSLYSQALDLNPEDDYVYRQLAWIEHGGQHWDCAAKYAIDSYKYSNDNPSHILQIALILALNTYKNFKKAKYYFEKAVEASNNDKQYQNRFQQYSEAEKMFTYITSIDENELIPSYIAELFNPKLSFYRNYYRSNTKEYRRKLIYTLDRMSSSTNCDVDLLSQAVDGYNVKGDMLIKSKYCSNLGRILYLQWYTNEKIIDASKILGMLKKSLQINNNDSFTHCWLGTYYKEVIRDFSKAEKEYKAAIRLSEMSTSNFVCYHPIFTNNLGLLFMDGVTAGIYEPGLLYEARKNFELSIQYNNNRGGDFYWAEYNLSKCLELMMRYQNGRNKKLDGTNKNDQS